MNVPEINQRASYEEPECLQAAGLADSDVAAWIAARQSTTGGYDDDQHNYSHFWARSDELIRRLPEKPLRNNAEAAAASLIFRVAREHRERFLTAHAATIYDQLTHDCTRFLRIDDLLREAAIAVPGLTPTPERVGLDSNRLQRDKDGIEIDQGIFVAHVLAGERSGTHLCHAMLLPRPEVPELLPRLEAGKVVDLGGATVERIGKATRVTMCNPRFLNAEDQTTIDPLEIAVDLATLDPATPIAVLRGAPIDHPKYGGRRVFGSGVNLTRLYRGEIPFVWFLNRDLGPIHKFVRGVATPTSVPDDVHGYGIEKPWIAAVDGFAIGGHCQTLLAMDYTVAASDAFLTLPARKEGIIPGAANLRMPRFTGDRIARQAIQYERKLPCDTPEGRLICDEVVAPQDMDDAIERVVDGLASAGAVSALGNRRALRVGGEPLDLFRRYCSVYARDQAYCCFSPALIANLERNWDAKNKKV
jgi:(3,5-dihydroxyphenyl)acetyl-CoA 1,2-dioxygenase